jgi:hypothetical protein
MRCDAVSGFNNYANYDVTATIPQRDTEYSDWIHTVMPYAVAK